MRPHVYKCVVEPKICNGHFSTQHVCISRISQLLESQSLHFVFTASSVMHVFGSFHNITNLHCHSMCLSPLAKSKFLSPKIRIFAIRQNMLSFFFNILIPVMQSIQLFMALYLP